MLFVSPFILIAKLALGWNGSFIGSLLCFLDETFGGKDGGLPKSVQFFMFSSTGLLFQL